jgi:hypothetical protein
MMSYAELKAAQASYKLLQEKYDDLKANTSSRYEILEKLIIDNHKETQKKLDEIQSSLNALSADFITIKNLPREVDEKMTRFYESIDSKISKLLSNQVEIESYINEIKRWFDYYDMLEPQSQKYLPEAEYIFDQISQLENPDYSPFILQYCRALENELLKKIFRAYVQSLIDRNIDIKHDFAWDLGKKESGKPNSNETYRLSNHLICCLKMNDEEEWFFELGTMEINLRNLTGKTVGKSPLLQDLKEFVLTKFESEILDIQYLNEIKTIISDYRNQSAHPNLIGTEQAGEFHKQIKECLVNLMKNYKNNRS